MEKEDQCWYIRVSIFFISIDRDQGGKHSSMRSDAKASSALAHDSSISNCPASDSDLTPFSPFGQMTALTAKTVSGTLQM